MHKKLLFVPLFGFILTLNQGLQAITLDEFAMQNRDEISAEVKKIRKSRCAELRERIASLLVKIETESSVTTRNENRNSADYCLNIFNFLKCSEIENLN